MVKTLHKPHCKFTIIRLLNQNIHWMFRIFVSCTDSLLMYWEYQKDFVDVGYGSFDKIFSCVLPDKKIPITTTKGNKICKLPSFILYRSSIKGYAIKRMLSKVWRV